VIVMRGSYVKHRDTILWECNPSVMCAAQDSEASRRGDLSASWLNFSASPDVYAQE
jgi:hypothetical protein